MVDKKDIEFQVEEWCKRNLTSKFEFREYQKETIVNIVYNIIEDKNHTQIIEAPTGSGKSLLNIISACVVYDYYDMPSYILVSDLYLWKQYEDFINKNIMLRQKIGIIKGQTGNYVCERNGEDMRNADCRMGGVSWSNMFNPAAAQQLGYECALRCPYVKARKKALRSGVVIMTYALYHYMMNIVAKTMPDASNSFKIRDIIFCDECHNIPSIMKMNFTPSLVYKNLENLKLLYTYRENQEPTLFTDEEDSCEPVDVISMHYKWEEIENEFNRIFDIVYNPNASKSDDFNSINDYISLLGKYTNTINQIESDLSNKKQVLHEAFTKDDLAYYKMTSWYRNSMCQWNDFGMALQQVGDEFMIKLLEENRNTKDIVASYNIVKEDFISWAFLLREVKHRIMMSATVGGYDAFADNIGIHYIESDESFGKNEEILYTIIPSTFDFSKSPVHFLNRYKMSYREKEQNFPMIQDIIFNICKQFGNERGMIQTGSYANAKAIYDAAPPEIKSRLLMYNGSKEKGTVITTHQMSRNTILIGPTLVEGIDLPGDQCRFIAIMKVPYPVITDKYTKKKMELFPEWYNSTTSNTIIQGIGRGNRFKDDYCITYILDACFLSLYNATKDQYATELQQRIKIHA